jgi:tRNA nucleotidyltransferase (CCA-adding enzyme)
VYVHVFDKVIVDVVLLAPVGVDRAVTATVALARLSPFVVSSEKPDSVT